MTIYKIIGYPLDCEGRSLLPEALKYYTSYTEAEKYKKAWLELWKKHTDNREGISPCWYDYLNCLDIKEMEVEEKFTGI